MVARTQISAASRAPASRKVRAGKYATFSAPSMNPTHRIAVRASSGTYEVWCGRGILARAGAQVSRLGENTGIFILSSPRVWKHWGPALRASFRGGSKTILFDDRETSKRLPTVERLCRQLVSTGADRRAVIVALGGGVVGDVAGFVAASFLRGVRLVHLPTTLVAQVDSAVGGKTGVNLPEGKNLVGAFYPPRLVITDPDLLGTLADREFRGGLAEVVKHAVISDAPLFARLEKDLDRILRRDREALGSLVARNVQIKARVVSRDERESGLREILNFGHTFAHALESATLYRRYQHGEAVAWGMMAAAFLGYELKVTPAPDVLRIISLVCRLEPLPPWPSLSPAVLLDAMRSDKRSRSRLLRVVLSVRFGRARPFASVLHAPAALVLRSRWLAAPG